ncbi:MAG: tripartite tricarboxylate transporter permease [Proteobacteria bacterium]|nr:tripartite tricarboxylate transporter permease [Pseudomonadota bacterium]
MEDFNNLMMGFSVVMQPYNLMVVVVGLILGIIVGVLPGLGGANGVAILIPIVVTMPATSGMIFLCMIYWGALYGGSITSILFNIPGEPWAVAATFDGYPMAKGGKPGKALVLAFLAHGAGAIVGVVVLTFFAPILAEFALRFGPAEVFAVMMLTFSAFVGLGGKSPLKTVTAILFGFILASVGMDIVSGQLRMTYGTFVLMGGFHFIVAVIGLFGLGEIFLTVEEGLKVEGVKVWIGLKDIRDGMKDIIRYPKALIMGTLIGCWMGFKPGGATPASFMAYGFCKQASANADEFGKGAPAGIIAPEAAAHAAGTSATIPMITLGIPGSPTMAVIMGGLMIFGLQPGPMLFVEHKDFVWGLIASTWVGNILGFFVVMAFAPIFASILRVRFAIFMPLIIYVCAIGAYAVNNRMMDVYYMLMFGVLGYLFKKLDYPIAPMVLALVLGDMAEQSMRQALIIGHGSPLVFFTLPLALPLMVAAIIIFFWPVIGPWKAKLFAKKA